MSSATVQAGVVIERGVMIPLRDGVRLSADIFRPDAPGRFPTLVARSPYGLNLPDVPPLARAGYAVVQQDTRGRFGSEGEWYPMLVEGPDGYDTVEWAAAQPWSDGRVGTIGGSYGGFAQWSTAVLQPPHLVAMAPHYAENDHYRRIYADGGALRLSTVAGWAASVSQHTAARKGVKDPLLAQLPTLNDRVAALARGGAALKEVTERSAATLAAINGQRPFRATLTWARLAPWLLDWLDHTQPDDPYWTPLRPAAKFDKITVPSVAVSGWYDYLGPSTLDSFVRLQRYAGSPEARRPLVAMGPWTHGGTLLTRAGEVDFGAASHFDIEGLERRWFDHWLRGVENGVQDEPPVRLFVMGANAWRDEQEWPLARTRYTAYYLHSGGHANTAAGDGVLTTEPPADEQPDGFSYDPRDPLPSRGGFLGADGAGAYDQRPIEGRRDLLVYTTAPLQRDLEVTGPVTLELWATSSAPCTDFTAKLVDVHPDGTAINLCDGVMRARGQGLPLTPGAAYRFAITVGVTSNLFKAGHRIRLHVSSSNYPAFAPNPNTPTSFAAATAEEFTPAEQSVLHDRLHPSHLLLPVIPE